MKCRKRIRRCRNRGVPLPPGSARENPEACPSGIRHVGGAKLNQALVRNVRTCRSDAKGDVQAAHTARTRVPKRSTGAEHRSRDEGSVMELDRRGCVVQPRLRANRRREEPMGKAKPFDIPKREVWEAFKRVKANQGLPSRVKIMRYRGAGRRGSHETHCWRKPDSNFWSPSRIGARLRWPSD